MRYIPVQLQQRDTIFSPGMHGVQAGFDGTIARLTRTIHRTREERDLEGTSDTCGSASRQYERRFGSSFLRLRWVYSLDSDAAARALQLKLLLAHSVMSDQKHECAETCN